MNVDPITRQAFQYASQISCDCNPQNVIALHTDTNHYYVLTPEPNTNDTPLLFAPTQVQSAINPTTFTAQDGIVFYSPNILIIPYSLVRLLASHL